MLDDLTIESALPADQTCTVKLVREFPGHYESCIAGARALQPFFQILPELTPKRGVDGGHY